MGADPNRVQVGGSRRAQQRHRRGTSGHGALRGAHARVGAAGVAAQGAPQLVPWEARGAARHARPATRWDGCSMSAASQGRVMSATQLLRVHSGVVFCIPLSARAHLLPGQIRAAGPHKPLGCSTALCCADQMLQAVVRMWVQRFKAPPSPFSGQRGQRDSNGNGSHHGGSAAGGGSDAAAAALQHRLAAGGNGGAATLRDGSDGSDNGWEEVLPGLGTPPTVPNFKTHAIFTPGRVRPATHNASFCILASALVQASFEEMQGPSALR